MLYSVISVESKDFMKDSIDQQQRHTLAFNHEDGAGGAAPHQCPSQSRQPHRVAEGERRAAGRSGGQNRGYWIERGSVTVHAPTGCN